MEYQENPWESPGQNQEELPPYDPPILTKTKLVKPEDVRGNCRSSANPGGPGGNCITVSCVTVTS
jgi:hypothetical protein